MNKIWETKGIYIFPALLLFMLLILFSQYIFSDHLMLYTDIGGDTIKFNWPSYVHYSRYLHREGIPKWSFEQGLGQNVFPAYLGDIPSWLLYVISPEKIAPALAWIQIFKIFLAGVFFLLFLRCANFNVYVATIGGLLYSFSGFMIIGSTWFIFSTEACCLALLLYGFEMLRRDNNLLVFPLAVAFIAAFNPFLLYLDCLLLVVYLFFSTIQLRNFKSISPLLRKTILLGTLGLIISSFLTFGSLNQMLESPRGSGNASCFQELFQEPLFKIEEGIYYKTFVLRLFGNDMAGYAGPATNSYPGWVNYLEAPMQYCSLLSLLLLPQLFALAGRKTKALATLGLLLALLPVIFPFGRYAFWLFQGNYFRTYSLFFSVLQILLALKSLELIISNRKVNVPLLFGTLLLCLLIVFGLDLSNKSLRLPVTFFLFVEAVILALITRPRLFKIAYTLILPVLIIELVCMSWGALNNRAFIKKSELVKPIGYDNQSPDAIQFLQKTDKSFYRLQKGKEYAQELGDDRIVDQSMLQDYYGVTSYHPFNQRYYVNFLQKMRLISDTNEWETRLIHGLGSHSLLSDLVGVKYQLEIGDLGDWGTGYDSIAAFKGLKVFKNRFFLPLGFTYRNYISEKEMTKTGSRRDVAILQCCVVNDSVYHVELQGLSSSYAGDVPDPNSGLALMKLVSELKTDTLQIDSFSQNHISGTITTGRKKILFFSIPFDKGWTANIDGREQKAMLINYGFLGYPLEPGIHRIELNYLPPYYYAGMSFSALGLLLYCALLLFSLTQYKRKRRGFVT